MVITVDGSKAVLKGYEHEFERKSAGRGDGAFMPEEQYGSLHGIGEAAVLNPLAFRMVGCTDGGAAKGAGAGIVSLRGAHKARSRGQEVLLERDTGSCSGMLIYPNGATISCNCAFRFTKTQSETAPVKTETATRLPAGRRGDGSKDASDKPEEKDTDKKPIIEPITITSVSWIDRKKILESFNGEEVSRGRLIKQWSLRTMVAALITSNEAPPDKLKLDELKKRSYEKAGLYDDFRALITYTLKWNEDGELEEIADKDLNPGFTPEPDMEKIREIPRMNKILRWFLLSPPERSQKFLAPEVFSSHRGEKSPLSDIVLGKKHPASSLEIPEGAEVLSSALIKFRMGEENNSLLTGKFSLKILKLIGEFIKLYVNKQMGKRKQIVKNNQRGGKKQKGDSIFHIGSPFHAPWVWCEHAVIRQGDTVKLLASGSHFPSHAWYVNGKKVGTALQETVRISKDEPVLSTGMPVSVNAPAGPAWPKAKHDTLKALKDRPKYKQPVTQHKYTLPAQSEFLRSLSDRFFSKLLPNGNVTERQCTALNRFEHTFPSDLLW